MHRVRKRWKSVILVFCFFLLAGAFMSLTLNRKNAYGTDEVTIKSDKNVYEKYCVICHGEKGDGKGLIGIIHRVQKSGLVWAVYPRDFTVGVFKFRFTPTGYLPTDEDLMRVIEIGIPRSGMPSHKDVPLAEREAVKEYIKTFAKRWQEEEPGELITVIKPEWVGTPASVARGKEVYS